jgi:glycopeptide antibiotics resistance protein
MTAHVRFKWVLAVSALIVTTSLMWSDTAISWWSNIVSFFMRINYEATTSVMNSRQNGDADLHAVLWGITAVIVLLACTSRSQRLWAMVFLGLWSVFVEFSQPWFTELRSRQATDLIGNALGLIGVLVVFETFAHRRRHN